MADSLALKMRLEDEHPKAGVPECLVDTSRKIVLHGLAHADDPAAISTELASKVSSKAFPLKVLFGRPGSIISRPSQGQVSFLRGNRIQGCSPSGSPQYAVVPTTAKHNLRNLSLFEAKEARVCLPWDVTNEGPLSFADLNCECKQEDRLNLRGLESGDRPVFWEYGIDISQGDVVKTYSEGITSEAASFELVRSGFKYEKGQRVGVAVKMLQAPTLAMASHSPEHPLSGLTQTDLEGIYGRPDAVNIYTGQITLVGEKHIEYDINTFTGCSGAIVFLLDQGQPDSVDPTDYGKAIAVHSGAHPSLLDRNFGFKILGR